MKLSEICSFQSKRVKSNALSVENYISTENMLPNKRGITSASKVPSEAAIAYQRGDILISNIRPYFKKIWHAEFAGGCSSDVLCIRANNLVSPNFLYHLLSQDSFFEYVMSGAKGSKMPRGDRNQIMNWDIDIPSIEIQVAIARILDSIDNKIRLNNRINHNLEEQADKIVSHLLFKDGDRIVLKDICRYGTQRINTSLLALNNYISTENMLPSKGGITESSGLPDGTAIEYIPGDTLVSNIRPYFKKIYKASYNGGCSNDVLCFRSTTNTPSVLYHILRQEAFFEHMMMGAKGSKMPRGDKSQILNWSFNITANWESFESALSDIDNCVTMINRETKVLAKLRDTLLPSLMSGKLKINEIDC